MKVSASAVEFDLTKPFGISRGQKTTANVLQAEISQGAFSGRGEGVPYQRYADTSDLAITQIRELPAEFSRQDLRYLLPAGSARNALDAALWELECKTSGQSIWSAVGLHAHRALSLGYTVSLRDTAEMIQDAQRNSRYELIKIKLGGPDDKAVMRGIKEVAPHSRLIVDVNEGWSLEELDLMVPVLVDCGVELLEQPLPAELDAELKNMSIPIPLCADESFHPNSKIWDLSLAFDCVNIKLDKSGGLTTAIQDLAAAREAGLKVMVGCMVSSSLAIAPAFILAQQADYWDLDGFLSIATDRSPSMRVENGAVDLPVGLWC